MPDSNPILEPSDDPPPKPLVWFFGKAFSHIRNTLLTGVVAIIPLVVTYFVLKFAYDVITGISATWLEQLNIKLTTKWVGFFLTLLIVYLLGLMATNMIGRALLTRFEALLLRIPLVATIYAGVKQVMDTLRTFNAGMNFKRVVYVPYPSEGSYMLGYVTGVYRTEIGGKEVTNVFLPTSPNPMTGFVILIDSDKVIEADLTMEEASKIILSAGLLTPRRATEIAASPAETSATSSESSTASPVSPADKSARKRDIDPP